MHELVIAQVLLACHPSSPIAYPVIDGASMLILASDGSTHRAFALDAGTSPPLPEIAYRGHLELRALAFRCPLSVFDVDPGPVALLPRPADVPRLPPFAAAFSSTIDGGQEDWAPIAALEPAFDEILRSLDLPEDTLCDAYAPPYRVITASRRFEPFFRPTFAAGLGDGAALIGTEGGVFFRASLAEAGVEITPIPPTVLSTGSPSTAAFVRAGGEIWLYDNDGRLARGRLDGAFEILPVRTSTSTLLAAALAGSPGDPFELFILGGDGVLGRFDGSRYEELYRGNIPGRTCGTVSTGEILPRVAWLGPGEIVATGARSFDDSIVVRRNEAIEERELPTVGDDDWPTSVAHLDRFGTLVGTCSGGLFLDAGSGLELLPNPPTNGSIRSISTLGPSLIYSNGTARPNVARYHPVASFCGAETAPRVDHIASLSEDAVLLLHECATENDGACGSHEGPGYLEVTVLTLDPEDRSCLEE